MGDTKEEIEADDMALDDELFRSRADEEERDRKIAALKEGKPRMMDVAKHDQRVPKMESCYSDPEAMKHFAIGENERKESEALERRAAAYDACRGSSYLLKQLRDAGWRVAIHNDYEIEQSGYSGRLMTRWLFTHPNGEYVTGEASTDLGALRLCAIKAESFAKGWVR